VNSKLGGRKTISLDFADAAFSAEAGFVLAFFRGHRKKCGRLLLHVRTSTLRTLWNVIVVLVQAQDQFEGFIAIEANIIVDGHGNLP
jgi:hypothetical protein